MSMLENLLRLHRWQLEERRRYLGELESLAERLRADAQRLATEFPPDFDSLDPGRQPETSEPPFARKSIDRRIRLEHSTAEIEAQIVEACAAVAAAENEVAHYELATEQRTNFGPGAVIHGSRRLRDKPSDRWLAVTAADGGAASAAGPPRQFSRNTPNPSHLFALRLTASGDCRKSGRVKPLGVAGRPSDTEG